MLEHRDEYDTAYAAIRSIGATCNVGAETLRKSVRQTAVDAGQRPGVSSEERPSCAGCGRRCGSCAAPVRFDGRLGFFAAELDRPQPRS